MAAENLLMIPNLCLFVCLKLNQISVCFDQLIYTNTMMQNHLKSDFIACRQKSGVVAPTQLRWKHSAANVIHTELNLGNACDEKFNQ